MIEVVAAAIDATEDEVFALEVGATRAAFVGSPLWYALPPGGMPDPGAPLDDVIDWCGSAIGMRRDVLALGAMIGLVWEIYAAHGWAIAAAHAAIGDFVEIHAQVAARARDRVIAATAGIVAEMNPDLAALEAVGVEPPGGDLVRGTLVSAIRVVADEAGRADHEAVIDHVAQMFGLTLPPAPVTNVQPLDDVGAALHDLGRHEWTWAHVAEWRDGDALLLAKAIARGCGAARVVELLVRIRHEVADRLAGLVVEAWHGEVAQVVAQASVFGETPLVDAVLDLAEGAAARAGLRIARSAVAMWEGGRAEDLRAVCSELLGDPRDVRPLWEAHVDALREASA
ncbi:MAG: hypothetical protein QM831_44725 [Kofleriaceae bacterium]